MDMVECPSKHDLSAFNLGDLPPVALDAISQHLESCPTCEAFLETLDGRTDPAIAALRYPKANGGRPSCPPGQAGMSVPAMAQQIGPYELLAKIGEGGMGTVYKAKHTRLDKVVVVKVLSSRLTNNPEAVARFQREMRAVGKLRHPHIVGASDAGEADGVHFLAMEFVEGVDLGSLVRHHGRLPLEDACALVRQAAAALQHAHDHGLVHRDIKPSNLMLAADSTLKVLDLGLALLQDGAAEAEPHTASGMIMGSCDYMAPEQADDPRGVDGRADLYSLGCTLYHLLAGQPPFSGPRYRTPLQKMKAHAQEEATPIQKLRPEVPAALAGILERLLAKDPAQRFPRAAAVANALEPFSGRADFPLLLEAVPASAKDLAPTPSHPAGQPENRPPGAAWKFPKSTRPRKLLGWAVAAAVLLLAGGVPGILILLKSKEAKETRIEVPEGSRVQINNEGQVVVELPARGALAAPADSLEAARIPRTLWRAAGGDAGKAPPGLVAVLSDDLLRHPGPVRSVAFIDQGNTLVSFGHENDLRFWDPASGTRRHILHLNAALEPWQPFAISKDGKKLALAGKDGSVKLFEVRLAKKEKGVTTPPRVLHPRGQAEKKIALGTLTFSPDSRTLAVRYQDGLLCLLDPSSGTVRHTFQASASSYQTSFAFSADGQSLAVAGNDGSLKIWGQRAGKVTRVLDKQATGLDALVFSGNGQLLAACANAHNQVKLWDATTGKDLGFLDGDVNAPWVQVFSPDSQTMVTGGVNGQLDLWDTATRKHRRRFWHLHCGPITGLAFSPDGRTLASSSLDGTIKLWDVQGGPKFLTHQGHIGAVHCLAVSRDGRTLLSGGADRTAKLWDLKTGKLLHTLSGHPADLLSVDFSSKGRLCATAARDGTVMLWDAASGKLQNRLKASPLGIRGLVFSPDGRTFATAGQGGLIKLWDTASGKPRGTLSGHKGPVTSVAFNHDGHTLASASDDHTVKLWDLTSARDLLTLKGHSAAVLSVGYLADDKTLASSAADGTVKLWDLDRGSQRRTLRGHTGLVYLACRRDSSMLASSSLTDGTVRLWDLQSDPPRQTVLPQKTVALAFTTEGRFLATGNLNGTIYILRLGPMVPPR